MNRDEMRSVNWTKILGTDLTKYQVHKSSSVCICYYRVSRMSGSHFFENIDCQDGRPANEFEREQPQKVWPQQGDEPPSSHWYGTLIKLRKPKLRPESSLATTSKDLVDLQREWTTFSEAEGLRWNAMTASHNPTVYPAMNEMMRRWQEENMREQPYHNIEAVTKADATFCNTNEAKNHNSGSSVGYLSPSQ
jgi:hypothetical protein